MPVLKTGALAAVTTTAALALASWARERRAAAALNAVSHILYGEKALRRDRPSPKYTLTGIALNAAAVTGWAAVRHVLFGRRREPLPRALLRGAATSALAYAVDYAVVPERLTPGFERRLSRPALFAVYAVLALSLAQWRPSREFERGRL